MKTAAEAAGQWRAAAERGARNWRDGLTPQELLAGATRSYLNGNIDLAAFERLAAEAIRDGA